MVDQVTTSRIERMPSVTSAMSEKLPVDGKDAKGLAIVDIVESGSLDEHEKVIYAEDQFTERDYSRLRWKVDLIIMPILMVIFGLNYSDKTSLSSGVIFVSDAAFPRVLHRRPALSVFRPCWHCRVIWTSPVKQPADKCTCQTAR